MRQDSRNKDIVY